ncbi:MAG: hypothetical protein KatS3mg058_3519 [Roseiflexus sp.]|jgi:hypothetical protein|nr:MAG: hypothetical protein KatS3mg058_3519 [Roseiflexus sp.]
MHSIRILSDDVNQTILLRDPPRPYICTQILERFWLVNTLERIVHNGFDQ